MREKAASVVGEMACLVSVVRIPQSPLPSHEESSETYSIKISSAIGTGTLTLSKTWLDLNENLSPSSNHSSQSHDLDTVDRAEYPARGVGDVYHWRVPDD